MASVVGSFSGGKSFLADYFASAALTAGQVAVREATASNIGEATNPSSTTSVTDVVGVLLDQATSNTAPTKEPGLLLVVTTGGLENIVRVDSNPLAIFRFIVSGGTADNTALPTAAPANILTNTVLSSGGTVITALVGTVDMSGGLIKGRTGNNAGSIRKMVSQIASTSTTVGIAFVNAIAVNDTFIRVPFSRVAVAMTLTTPFDQANGNVAFSTSTAKFRVVNVNIDEQNSIVTVDVIATLHFYNKNS